MAQMVAQVILKGAKTYTNPTDGKRWIKDVPQLVKGEEKIEGYKTNGYFYTHIIKKGDTDSEGKKSKKKSSKNKSKSKGGKAKSGNKKTKLTK